MDLLTVVNHEISHVLGVGHSEEGLMNDVLGTGEQFVLDDSVLDYDQLVQDDDLGDDEHTLDALSSDDLLAANDVSVEVDTHTSYADDLIPSAENSLQVDTMSGSELHLEYASVSVDQPQESVI